MPIKRQAILIGSPSVHPKLPGVKRDMEALKSYLMSDAGGQWKSDEIVELTDPGPSVLKVHMALAKTYDYVFISCSGHGEHQVSGSLDETVMYLTNDITIPISEINPGNKRHFVLVDVCRNLVDKKPEQHTSIKAAMEELVENQRIDYRKLFDDAVMSCPEGRIVAYSCGINQSAGDDGTGGVFTKEFIRSPIYFDRKSSRIMDIKEAFDIAREKTFIKNKPQNPELNAGRRMNFYPFAILD